MNQHEMKRPIEWATRINQRWIVHHGLGTRADDWMNYLSESNPARLRKSCETADRMIRLWDQEGDPKPWFYSGLFSGATAEEAKKFLAGHRLTTATVPAMKGDQGVIEWENSLCYETKHLLQRLRAGIQEVSEVSKDSKGKKV